MKIEQLLVQYLYHNKNVSLQDIGNFTISPEVAIPGEKDKETLLPEGAIQFTYNPREQKDEELIDYIVDQTGKIRFLAMSDLESYSSLSRQFLNIGKPLEIPGLGSLLKTQEGKYEFLQSKTMQHRFEKRQKIVEEKKSEDISFSTPSRERKSNSGVLATVVILFLLATAAAAYYLLKNDSGNELVEEETIPINQVDTTQNISAALRDSSATPIDSTAKYNATGSAAATANDGSVFKIVLKDYNSKIEADRAFSKLSSYGHKLVIGQKDSATYQVMMPFTTPLSDTARAKDSLRRFFGGSPYVKL